MPTLTCTLRAFRWVHQIRRPRGRGDAPVGALAIRYDWGPAGGPQFPEHHVIAGGLLQRDKTVPEQREVGTGPDQHTEFRRLTGEWFDPTRVRVPRNEIAFTTVNLDLAERILASIDRNVMKLARNGFRTQLDPRWPADDAHGLGDDPTGQVIQGDLLGRLNVERAVDVPVITNDLRNGTVGATYSGSPTASDEDAYEQGDDTGFDSTSATIFNEAHTTDANRHNAGVVVSGTSVFSGATIDAGTDLTVNVPNTSRDDPWVTIGIENAATAVDFTANADVTNRSQVATTVDWHSIGIGAGSKTSPELQSTVAVYAALPGGNVMCVLSRGDASETHSFRWAGYDHASLPEAIVDVTYTAAAGVSLDERRMPRGVLRGVARGAA